MKTISVFLYSTGAIFILTGMAKVWSAFGSARLLAETDPILGLSFRHLMLAAGTLELAAGGFCLFGKSRKRAVILVAWLATSFVAYRLGLWRMNWQRPCHCLGNLTDALHISSQTADTIMKIILAYLLCGSYLAAFWLWARQRNAFPVSTQPGKTTNSEASRFPSLEPPGIV